MLRKSDYRSTCDGCLRRCSLCPILGFNFVRSWYTFRVFRQASSCWPNNNLAIVYLWVGLSSPNQFNNSPHLPCLSWPSGRARRNDPLLACLCSLTRIFHAYACSALLLGSLSGKHFFMYLCRIFHVSHVSLLISAVIKTFSKDVVELTRSFAFVWAPPGFT